LLLFLSVVVTLTFAQLIHSHTPPYSSAKMGLKSFTTTVTTAAAAVATLNTTVTITPSLVTAALSYLQIIFFLPSNIILHTIKYHTSYHQMSYILTSNFLHLTIK
jgi:hypothetical protein